MIERSQITCYHRALSGGWERFFPPARRPPRGFGLGACSRGWLPGLIWTERGAIVESPKPARDDRDDPCCSRLLDLLWRDEAAAIAVRTGVIPGRVPKQFNRSKVLSMLARLLTGHEVVKEVCLELRARQLVGMGSGPPLRPAAPSPTSIELPLPPGARRPINEGREKNR